VQYLLLISLKYSYSYHMQEQTKPSVVVVGGGTGTHTVLRGLKRYADRITITAVVSMADSGGSTGRLRDAFGYLPVGDVRMALAALASDVDAHEELMRELFLYRFGKGEGLSGHNFGNLLLTALTDLVGSEAEAVAAASRILRVRGAVLPVTDVNVALCAEYDDGVVVKGEHLIDDPPRERYARHIERLFTEPEGMVTEAAATALRTADLIVLGPGDLYSSLLANCVIDGVSEAIVRAPGTFVFVANLMERPGQTVGMSVADCVEEVARYVGREPDVIIVNDAPLPQDEVAYYEASEGTAPVVDDAGRRPGRVIRTPLIAHTVPGRHDADTVKRSLIRHDADLLADALRTLW
jgi:uncharacterized cofD-like protein